MKNFILLLIFTLVIGCGFKVVNKSQSMNFNLKEINTSGENRINYKLKNKLLIFNQNENNYKSYNINLKTDKIKKIKEKNINNVITKYEIEVSTQVIVKTLQEKEVVRFTQAKVVTSKLEKRHSQTISNEKKLISLITNDLADQIIDQLFTKLNDL